MLKWSTRNEIEKDPYIYMYIMSATFPKFNFVVECQTSYHHWLIVSSLHDTTCSVSSDWPIFGKAPTSCIF